MHQRNAEKALYAIFRQLSTKMSMDTSMYVDDNNLTQARSGQQDINLTEFTTSLWSRHPRYHDA